MKAPRNEDERSVKRRESQFPLRVSELPRTHARRIHRPGRATEDRLSNVCARYDVSRSRLDPQIRIQGSRCSLEHEDGFSLAAKLLEAP